MVTVSPVTGCGSDNSSGVQRGAGNQRAFLASGLEPEIQFQPREPERFAAVKFVADNRKPA
jgi:hypothetical protein